MQFHTERSEVRAVFRPDDGNLPGWAGKLRQTVTTRTSELAGLDHPSSIAGLPDTGWDQPDPPIEYPEGVAVEGELKIEGRARRASWIGDRFMPSG